MDILTQFNSLVNGVGILNRKTSPIWKTVTKGKVGDYSVHKKS